jgi:putative PEP-CTERM system TPR-repeat lipoprotein
MKKLVRSTLVYCLVLLTLACGADISAAKYIERAEEYLDKGNYNAASIELKNAIKKEPQNAGARWLLGKVYLESGDFSGAEKELKKASEFGMADEPVLPLLGEALLHQGKNDELQIISLVNLSADAQATVLAEQGLAKLAQRKPDKAAKLVDEALSRNPDSPFAIVAKARLMAVNQEFEAATAQLEKAFQVDPDYAPAWSLLGDIEEQQRHHQPAVDAYTRAIDNSTNNMGERLKRAMQLVQLGKHDEAQQDIDSIKPRAPRNPGVNYAQGLVYLNTEKPKEAQAAFDVAVKDEQHYPMAIYYLAVTHLQLGNQQQAESQAERFHTINPNNIAGRKLLASIYLDKQEYSEAEAIIQPVVYEKENDTEALNILATSLFKQGKTEAAIEILVKVAELAPDSPEAQTRLGEAFLFKGKRASGQEHLENALQLDPDHAQADVLLILDHLKNKDYGLAIEAAEDYQKKAPDIVTPYNLAGRIYIKSGQTAEAKAAFEKARSISPGDPYACQQLASLAIKEGDADSAHSYYEEILNHHENHLSTLVQVAGLYALEGNQQLMVRNLDLAITAHPRALQPRIILARYYLAIGKLPQVSFVLANIDDIHKDNPSVLNIIAVAQIAQKEFSQAKITIKRLIEVQPGSAETHYLMATTYLGLDSRKEAQAELEKSVILAPDFLPARLTLLRLMLKERNVPAAKEQLKALKVMAPENPEVIKLEASFARLTGEQQESLRLSRIAFEKSPTTSNMLILVHALWDSGDKDGSLRLLQTWVEDRPKDVPARIELANALAANKQLDAAIDQYNKVLDRDNKNLVALNNIAWYLRDTDPEQALGHITRANDLKPGSAALMETQAVVLLKNGDIERAKRTITRALRISPNDPSLRYHSAMISASAGDTAIAIATLESLVKEEVIFKEKDDASKLLIQLRER